MGKGLMVAAAFLIGAPFLGAQSQYSKGFNTIHGRQAKFSNIERPTRVSGDGASTTSGVKYWDIAEGKGSPASRGHAVKVTYRAWVANGREFASSVMDGGAPIFTLGAGQVIRGWEDGVEGMRVGGKRQLRIPPDLAYGAAGVPSLVPPNATLIFDVELIGLE